MNTPRPSRGMALRTGATAAAAALVMLAGGQVAALASTGASAAAPSPAQTIVASPPGGVVAPPAASPAASVGVPAPSGASAVPSASVPAPAPSSNGSGVASSPATAAGATTGTIAVRATQGASGPGLAGIALTLHGSPGTAAPDVTAAVKTGADGSAAFAGLSTGAGWAYTVTTLYKGVEFTTDRVILTSAQSKSLTLPVFDTTTSPAAVTQPTWSVWLDVEGSQMAVQQDVELLNSGTTSYIGDQAIAGKTSPSGTPLRAVTRLPLAAGAQNLQFVGRFETCCGVAENTVWLHSRTLDPGRSQGTLRYESPFTSHLSFPVTLPTQSFALLVPASLKVASAGLKPGATSTDRGVTYQIYTATGLTAGTTVEVTLTKAGSSAATSPLALVGYALLGVLAVGGAVVLVRRRSRAAPPASVPAPSATAGKARGKKAAPTPQESRPTRAGTTTASPAKGGAAAQPAAVAAAAGHAARPAVNGVAKADAPAASVWIDEPETADLLADELAMLDLAFESGVVKDEASYRRVRAHVMARLLAATEATTSRGR